MVWLDHKERKAQLLARLDQLAARGEQRQASPQLREFLTRTRLGRPSKLLAEAAKANGTPKDRRHDARPLPPPPGWLPPFT